MQSSDNSTSLGTRVLNMWDVFDDENWYWIGIGGLLGFTILFNGLFTLALAYLDRKFLFVFEHVVVSLSSKKYINMSFIMHHDIKTALGKPQAVIPKEEDEEKEQANKPITSGNGSNSKYSFPLFTF